MYIKNSLRIDNKICKPYQLGLEIGCMPAGQCRNDFTEDNDGTWLQAYEITGAGIHAVVL